MNVYMWMFYNICGSFYNELYTQWVAFLHIKTASTFDWNHTISRKYQRKNKNGPEKVTDSYPFFNLVHRIKKRIEKSLLSFFDKKYYIKG